MWVHVFVRNYVEVTMLRVHNVSYSNNVGDNMNASTAPYLPGTGTVPVRY